MRTSVQFAMPPTLKRKLREIESEHARPFWDVVRSMAESGMSRYEVADALGYHQSNFARLLRSRWAPRIEWRFDWSGERHHAAKLTADDVRLIRQLRGPGRAKPGDITLADIAEKFDVSYRSVWAVVNYETWSDTA